VTSFLVMLDSTSLFEFCMTITVTWQAYNFLKLLFLSFSLSVVSYSTYNTKFVKRHVAVASEALANRRVKKHRRRRTNVLYNRMETGRDFQTDNAERAFSEGSSSEWDMQQWRGRRSQ